MTISSRLWKTFPLSGVLLVGLLCSSGSSHAQAALNRPKTVAVLDFTVPPTRNDTILSRQATDAFATELQRVGSNEVIARNQVEQAIQEMGLTSRLTRSQLIHLGENLGVENIVIGRVEHLGSLTRPARMQAALRILVFDVTTGEFSNGTRVTGAATSDANLLAQDSTREDSTSFSAVSDAAFSAVRALSHFELPEATILQTSDDTAWLNGGVRNGIHTGQEFIILRHGQRVGRVRVTDVSSQDARAHIIDSGRGIRPEDRARLVIDPNDLPVAP